MAEIKKLMDRVKKLNKGNRLLAMVFIDDMRVSYSIYGTTSNGGTVYCADKNAVDEFISNLMEKHRISDKNCTVIVGDLVE